MDKYLYSLVPWVGNSNVCFTLCTGVPWWIWASVSQSDNLLSNSPYIGFFPFPVSLPASPISASWQAFFENICLLSILSQPLFQLTSSADTDLLVCIAKRAPIRETLGWAGPGMAQGSTLPVPSFSHINLSLNPFVPRLQPAPLLAPWDNPSSWLRLFYLQGLRVLSCQW